MEKRDFGLEVLKLRSDINTATKDLLTTSREVTIPYYYDVDECDEREIEDLIEDGYNVIEGYGDNLSVMVEEYDGVTRMVDIVSVMLDRNDNVVLVSSSCNIIYLNYVITLLDLVAIYNAVAEHSNTPVND